MEKNFLLHKYRDYKRGIEILRQGQIYFSPVGAFNDPFEGIPASDFFNDFFIDNKNIKKELMDITETRDGMSFMQAILPGAMLTSIALLSVPTFLIASYYLYKSLSKNEKKQYLSFLSEYFPMILRSKILSLSKDPENVLMWSHYADSHRGMVITFDPSIKYWKNIRLKEIEYKTQRLPLPTEDTNVDEYVEKIITRKSTCWEYEQEWRMINYHLQPNKNFVRFDKNAIKAVRLGLEMPKEQKEDIIELCREKYPNVKIYKMERSTKEYKLVSKEYLK